MISRHNMSSILRRAFRSVDFLSGLFFIPRKRFLSSIHQIGVLALSRICYTPL